SFAYRVDITDYPAKYGTCTDITDYASVAGYSQMAFDGHNFIVQSRDFWKGNYRRNVFDIWDDALTTKLGSIDFNWNVAGTLANPYAESLQKTQGICCYKGN